MAPSAVICVSCMAHCIHTTTSVTYNSQSLAIVCCCNEARKKRSRKGLISQLSTLFSGDMFTSNLAAKVLFERLFEHSILASLGFS